MLEKLKKQAAFAKLQVQYCYSPRVDSEKLCNGSLLAYWRFFVFCTSGCQANGYHDRAQTSRLNAAQLLTV